MKFKGKYQHKLASSLPSTRERVSVSCRRRNSSTELAHRQCYVEIDEHSKYMVTLLQENDHQDAREPMQSAADSFHLSPHAADQNIQPFSFLGLGLPLDELSVTVTELGTDNLTPPEIEEVPSRFSDILRRRSLVFIT